MQNATARKVESHECATFLEDHAAYMDECLSDDEAAAHEAHAASCPSCARYSTVLTRGLALVRELPEIEPSAHFEERLRHRIFHLEDAAQLERSGGRSFVGIAAAAMIALIAWSPMLLRTSRVSDVSVATNENNAVTAPATAAAGVARVGSALFAASMGSGRPDWYAQPASADIEQTPVIHLVSNAGSYSPLIVSPPAVRGPRAVRLVSATSQ